MDYGAVVTIGTEGPLQLAYCLDALRASEPLMPIRVVSDGTHTPEYAEVCRRFQAHYTAGDYLKRIECGGRWWERVLREGLATKMPVFCRVDPDCTVHGTFYRRSVKALLESGRLRSEALKELWDSCPDKDVVHLWYPLGHLDLEYQMVRLGGTFELAPSDASLALKQNLRPLKLVHCPPRGVSPHTVIRVITTCMSRLDHLQQTVPRWLAEPFVDVLVVDWSCPLGTADWVDSLEDRRVQVLRVPGQTKFNLAMARNAGAMRAARDLPEGRADWSREIWAFLDADVLVEPGWANACRNAFREGHYHIADPITRNMGGSVLLRPAAYFAAGGYDETLQGWGCDDTLFYLCARHAGIRAATYPGKFVNAIRHGDVKRTQNYTIKDKKVSNRIFDGYYRLKLKFMEHTGYLPSVEECQQIYEEALAWDAVPGRDLSRISQTV